MAPGFWKNKGRRDTRQREYGIKKERAETVQNGFGLFLFLLTASVHSAENQVIILKTFLVKSEQRRV